MESEPDMEDINILEKYINNIITSPRKAKLNLEVISDKNKGLAVSLQRLGESVKEMYMLAMSLANGELESDINSENNLCGPLKDLQSGLKHLTWQANCVEKGDYSLKVNFFGEFSKSFNNMTDQLKKREEEVREKNELERKQAASREAWLTQQLEQQLAYYKNMTDAHKKLRSFRHDTRNHYLCLDSLLLKGDIEEARKYVASISTVTSYSEIIINTNNFVFDALLTDKIGIAAAKNITITTKIAISRELAIANFDWCILFGNALDNAIEACEKVTEEKRQIWVKVQERGRLLNVSIVNTAAVEPLVDGEFYKTSKSDKEHHGIGLSNIAAVVEKYNGVLQTSFKEGKFNLLLMLCDV